MKILNLEEFNKAQGPGTILVRVDPPKGMPETFVRISAEAAVTGVDPVKTPMVRKLLDKHGLHDWRVCVENLRNPMYVTKCGPLLGFCDVVNKIIRIDCRYPRKFRQTLLHEIAHA